jgi:antitoxin component YwqK of YwqJK toxin-antitoxin module
MGMRTTLILLLLFGGQTDCPDSGFTNKAEAKNLMVNGLKEGKWVEYLDSAKVEIEGILLMTPTNDTNAPYYSLSVYKKGNLYGIAREYYKGGSLKGAFHFTNGNANGINRYITKMESRS